MVCISNDRLFNVDCCWDGCSADGARLCANLAHKTRWLQMTKYGWKYFTLNGSLRALGKVYYAADISGSFSSSQFHISMDLLRLMLPVQFRTNLIYARLNQNLSFMPSLLALVRVLSILFLPVLVHDWVLSVPSLQICGCLVYRRTLDWVREKIH